VSTRDYYRGAVSHELQDFDLRDDFVLDDLEDDAIDVYDVDGVLGYTADVLKVGMVLISGVAFLIGLIYIFITYI
jgi:hypothetical protein